MISPLPNSLFDDVDWSFIGGTESDFNRFCEMVRRDQIEISGNEDWNPKELVLPASSVRVYFRCHPLEEDQSVDLVSSGEVGFSAGELLFKLHNAVVDDLDDRDHHFLEKLRLNSQPVAGAPAAYVLELGS